MNGSYEPTVEHLQHRGAPLQEMTDLLNDLVRIHGVEIVVHGARDIFTDDLATADSRA